MFRRNRKGILKLATLNQTKIELVTVVHVNLLDVIRRVVVDNDALKLEIGDNLLLGKTSKSLANNLVLIKGRKDAGKVDSIRVESLLVGNGERNLGGKRGTPFLPRIQTRTFTFLDCTFGKR